MESRAASAWTLGLVVVLIVLIVATSAPAAWRGGDRFTLAQTREVRSGIDGLPYRVHENSTAAADTMAELNRRATELLRHLRGKYLRGPGRGAFPAREAATRRLLGLYNPDNLAENSPRDPEGDTSYTIDKGAILALCLRAKGPGGAGIHDMETLTFVTLHELTHIAVTDVDHPVAYWRTFKFVLQEAVAAGLLKGVDYSQRPTVYCGMNIDYNPFYDASLPPLA